MSDELAQSMLEPLDEQRRARLVTSMQEVERLLVASLIVIESEDPATDDARWCIEQYFAELAQRFDSGFDPALSIPRPSRTSLLPRACCSSPQPRAPRRLRRPQVPRRRARRAEAHVGLSRGARGLGLGGRLLAAWSRRPGDAGATVVRLETNGSLTEAIALYRKTGYSEVDAFNDEPYAHHWFEKRLAARPSRRSS